jgi:hypothetical protein
MLRTRIFNSAVPALNPVSHMKWLIAQTTLSRDSGCEGYRSLAAPDLNQEHQLPQYRLNSMRQAL